MLTVDSCITHVSTALVLVDYADDCVRILSMTKLLMKWCKYWNWNYF